jgi:hypothetical protein
LRKSLRCIRVIPSPMVRFRPDFLERELQYEILVFSNYRKITIYIV